MTLYNTADTICATATASGVGGIAIIRVSGREAVSLVSRLFTSPSGREILPTRPDRHASFGHICLGDEVLDEVVVTKFLAPASFTGEDVVEIACHGSSFIRGELLRALVEQGCRMAEPGEFSYRAYLNGKMDLSRAEAVADLVSAETKAQHTLALTQLRGGYSNRFNELREQLLQFAALMELELDFSEEDVTFADRSELLALAHQVSGEIRKLTESYRLGNALRRGVPTAIVGVTNAGKSTLLNQLVGEERAIVSDIHGTTRDTIEDVINLSGILFRFIDTAGLRQTEDQIESLGIERSYQKMQDSAVVLFVIDGERLLGGDEQQLELLRSCADSLTTQTILFLVNKSDLLSEQDRKQIHTLLAPYTAEGKHRVLFIAAKEGQQIDELRIALVEAMELLTHQEGDLIVSNARHHALLSEAGVALDRLIEGMKSGIPTDLLTPDLRLCIHAIGEVTGQEVTREETLHHIFRHFCIGK